MIFTVCYSTQSLKNLKKIPESWQRRIIKAISGLKEDPYEGKKLKGQMENLYSLRVWPYRIVYVVKKEEITVLVLDIGHRQNIYK